ncbi:MAG: hypothetical protein AB1742_00505 [bacterium]
MDDVGCYGGAAGAFPPPELSGMAFFDVFQTTGAFLALFSAICIVAGTAGGLGLTFLERSEARFGPSFFRRMRLAGGVSLAALILLVFSVSVLDVTIANRVVTGWAFMIGTFLLFPWSIAALSVGRYGAVDPGGGRHEGKVLFLAGGFFALFAAMLLLDAGFWFASAPVRNVVKSACLFLLVPVSARLIAAGSVRVARYAAGDASRASRALSLLFALMLFGDVSNHAHDFIWCGYVTGWYSEAIGANPSGFDLAPFVYLAGLVGIPRGVSGDYAVFGAYATLLMALELAAGSVLLWAGAVRRR